MKKALITASILTEVLFGNPDLKAQSSFEKDSLRFEKSMNEINLKQEGMIQVLLEMKDSIILAAKAPCSSSDFVAPEYYMEGWKIIILPKVSESDSCNDSLYKKLNEDLSRSNARTMDIQYSREEGCVPEIFMLSEVSKKPLLSTGHLSCFNTSICSDNKNGIKYYFNQHIDVTRVSQNKKLDSLYKNTLLDRLTSLKDSSQSDNLEVIIGASYIGSSADISQYAREARYILNAIKEKNVFRNVSTWFCSGPNTVAVNSEVMFENGGPDKFTTDIVVFPQNKKLYVVRPINPDLFDKPFKEVENQMENYGKYFKSNIPPYVNKLNKL